ncbi:uncharacterized protein LOC115620406 [Scaptodrosophila lebanonensis]|uniref:Uncharacterized protein LOC115620406 n=1 Tax=Drosophila lebanonensis TaxID=7225 RepID=A0A6J2T2M6_DROLE|nr:uncharacterized protein LOC115620406 [Scaptodrosophila lebanonensis]
MDDSRQSIAPNEASTTMYLSFDADDTIASKFQSIAGDDDTVDITTNGIIEELDETLEGNERNIKKTVLKCVTASVEMENCSPLRPFDNSIFNKNNALSSTPSKNVTMPEGTMIKAVLGTPLVPDGYDKENTHPDEGTDFSTCWIDGTASTVKVNDGTTDEISIQEANKTGGTGITNATALELIKEVSKENVSLDVPLAATATNGPTNINAGECQVNDVTNEMSELIAKALKLSDPAKPMISLKPFAATSNKLRAVPSLPMARPRRSYLPISGGEARTYSFKQRMSVVVKTTLNSPARKLIASNSATMCRRSLLPGPKLSVGGSAGGNFRKSVFGTATEESKPTGPLTKKLTQKVGKPKYDVDTQYKCKTCGATFRVKSLYDMHVHMHDMVVNGPRVPKKSIIPSPLYPASAASTNQKHACKYCDKNFALERALHIHLMQNCEKIPPVEKRKLQYTELNHVKKAQLPKITGSAAICTLKSHQDSNCTEQKSATANKTHGSMLPPSVKKVAKSAAHAGVYRTPTKSVPCSVCKQSFKSILDYTNHCLTVHSKKVQMEQDKVDDAQSAA